MKMPCALLVLFCAFAFQAEAQNDTLATVHMADVVVEAGTSSASSKPLILASSGKAHWNMESLTVMPSITGSVNPIAQLQTLPGIQTSNELDGGLHVQGFDNAHNLVSLDGIPVYNAFHLMGFFSIFNTSHFQDFTFDTSTSPIRTGRVGAQIDMMTADTVATHASGQFRLSPLEAMATTTLQTGLRSSLHISGRLSDVNLLYDWLINRISRRDETIQNNFYDINATWLWHFAPNDRLKVSSYLGRDAFKWFQPVYITDADIKWGNRLAGVTWDHDLSNGSLSTELFLTNFSSCCDIDAIANHMDLESTLTTYGLRTTRHRWTASGFVQYGIEGLWHQVHPLVPKMRTVTTLSDDASVDHHIMACEATAFVNWETFLRPSLQLRAGIRSSSCTHERFFGHVDPRCELRYTAPKGDCWHVTAGAWTQYLSQVSFTTASLPISYWNIPDSKHSPQHALKAEIGWERNIHDDSYHFGATIFASLLYGQLEYRGNLLSSIYETLALDNALTPCNGSAYGLTLLAQKQSGSFTGWLAATFMRSWRWDTALDFSQRHPSFYERPIEFNAVASYRLNSYWTFSSTALLAMGTPYTPVKRAYILQDNVLVEMGPLASARYPFTRRLDLSAHWNLPSYHQCRHALSFSIYNATWAQNPLLFRYGYSHKREAVTLQSMCLFTTCIPTVSYTFHF